VRLRHLFLQGHRSVVTNGFDAGPFTVLFGKNNAGKTNILEAIYNLFVPSDTRAVRVWVNDPPETGVLQSWGAIFADLEPGIPFDDQVATAIDEALPGVETNRVAFAGQGRLLEVPDEDVDVSAGEHLEIPYTIPGPDLKVLFLDWEFKDLHERVETAIASLASDGDDSWPWMEPIDPTDDSVGFEVNLTVRLLVHQLGSLATDLLPDFVDGSIVAEVNDPREWGRARKIGLAFDERAGVEYQAVDVWGHGAARWMAAAVQIALRLLAQYPDLRTLRDAGPRAFSGYVLLVDEPEAHLHPAAVASAARWCQRMVGYGFTVVVATHHEEFLRAPGDDVALVHVAKVHWGTTTRTLHSRRTAVLRELAADVGLHPATALSLHRAILFVEGTLDEAVLDEYGGLELDAAGIKIFPIHGTKNLEGLVTAEVVTGLDIKIGILTDATDPATMLQRSGNKRSSEERKVVRVVEIATQKGLPIPTVFGVPEDDLLFALPPDAIRTYLKGPFPGWKELRAECREALGKGPSDSVDWKSYALERYRLPITDPGGVRHIVRALDLDNVPLPSIRNVIDEVVNWAKG
jgi:energy-coupling factor transporter ATP-binding protein EcfA2